MKWLRKLQGLSEFGLTTTAPLISQPSRLHRSLHRPVSFVSAFTLSFSIRTVLHSVAVLTTSMAYDVSHTTTGTGYGLQFIHLHRLTPPALRQPGRLCLFGLLLRLSLSLYTFHSLLSRLSVSTICAICIVAIYTILVLFRFGRFIAGEGGTGCSTILLLLNIKKCISSLLA